MATKISPLADIEDSVRGTLIQVGARTVIDSFVKIKPAGGMGDVVIGADCAINSGTVIYTGNGVVIGDAVAIAANCTLAPTNHAVADVTRHPARMGMSWQRGFNQPAPAGLRERAPSRSWSLRGNFPNRLGRATK